jgi:hypothetical protein
MGFIIILLLGLSNLAGQSLKFIGRVLYIATVARNAHIRECCAVVDYQQSQLKKEADQKNLDRRSRKSDPEEPGQIHGEVYLDASSSPEIGRKKKKRDNIVPVEGVYVCTEGRQCQHQHG